MAGLALSRSKGAGDWRVGASDGQLTQTMTAVHPYLRWADASTSLWVSVGGGRGDAENLRTAGRLGTSATDLRLGLVELKRRLGASGRLDFGLMGDASWAVLGIVRLDAQARMLALHSAAGYRERGIVLALTVGQPGAEGLSLCVVVLIESSTRRWRPRWTAH